MAVCRQDRAYKDYTSNPIPTSFFPSFSRLDYEITANSTDGEEKKMWGWGYLCSLCMPCLACTLPSLYLVSVVFGTAIPISHNIFGKCFLHLYTSIKYTCTHFVVCKLPINAEASPCLAGKVQRDGLACCMLFALQNVAAVPFNFNRVVCTCNI